MFENLLMVLQLLSIERIGTRLHLQALTQHPCLIFFSCLFVCLWDLRKQEWKEEIDWWLEQEKEGSWTLENSTEHKTGFLKTVRVRPETRQMVGPVSMLNHSYIWTGLTDINRLEPVQWKYASISLSFSDINILIPTEKTYWQFRV
jgi:hypothetical protein